MAWQDHEFKATALPATGTVTGREAVRSGGNPQHAKNARLHCTLRFLAADGSEHEAKSTRNCHGLALGDTVRLYYQPQVPQMILLDVDYVAFGLKFVAVLVAVALGMAVLGSVRSTRRNS